MARRRIAAPEWIGQRLDENPDRWRGSNAAPLIAATLGDARRGIINATTDPSEIGELLRAFALVQSRWGITDLDTIREELGSTTAELVEIAHQYWLQELTNRAIGTKPSDWNDGTGSAIARSISTLDDPLDAFDAALPHLMTGSMNAINRALNDSLPQTVEALRKLRRTMGRHLSDAPRPSTYKYHGDSWRNDERTVARLAREIAEARAELERQRTASRARAIIEGTLDANGRRSPVDLGDAQWHEVKHSPNRLTRPHIGKIGAKRSPSDTGRVIRHPSRALTDPARRVFDRRARSKNALVVLDMSGSMNYTTNHLDEILERCRGAVVVGYSIASNDYNFHLLARDGMRVAELPSHGGANGLDGTALTYAVAKYRKNSTTPIVWVSDGEVNGLGDSTILAADMIQRLRKTGAHHVESASAAIELLDRMAQGHRPAPQIGKTLIGRALSR
jgi:hypothetical protein